jgi:uncharacterized protein YjaG (DUF416 family)
MSSIINFSKIITRCSWSRPYEQTSNEAGALTPDLLGEYFIVKGWSTNQADICKMEILMEIAWKYKPREMTHFILRTANDFKINEALLDRIVELTSGEDSLYSNRVSLLSTIAHYYHFTDNFTKVQPYHKLIEEIWENAQKDRTVNYHLAFVDFMQIDTYIKNKDFLKASELHKRLASIWDSYFHKDTDISSYLADTSNHIAQYYCDINKPNKAETICHSIMAIRENGHQQNEFIALCYANTLQSLISYFCRNTNLKKTITYYDQLNELWENSFQKNIDILKCLVLALVRLISFYRKTNNMEKAEEFSNLLKTKWTNEYISERTLLTFFSYPIVSLIHDYCKHEDFISAERHFEFIKQISDNDERDNNYLNKAATFLSVAYQKARIPHKVKEYDIYRTNNSH